MALRFDEKGKYYTDYITKESVPVILQTVSAHIRGYVYVEEDERLSDELNRSEQFLPVTQAAFFDDHGNVLYETDFILINRAHIIWLYPDRDAMDDTSSQPLESLDAVDSFEGTSALGVAESTDVLSDLESLGALEDLEPLDLPPQVETPTAAEELAMPEEQGEVTDAPISDESQEPVLPDESQEPEERG